MIDLHDITIDTNVLMHASNPTESRFEVAKQLLEALIEGETALAVDEGFDVDPAKNRSLIGQEYLTHLVTGTLGYSLVSFMAQNGRMWMVTRRVPAAMSRKLNQMVSNVRDRTFVRVALNSTDRVLVSHDFTDFPVAKRRVIADELGATIRSAEELI